MLFCKRSTNVIIVRKFFENNQREIALAIGYALVFLMAFGLGRMSVTRTTPPEIRIEEPESNLNQNDNAKVQGTQSQGTPAALQPAVETVAPARQENCVGKIKGNIGQSGKIYHLPGGASYKQTIPELCFETEAEAQSAGFRKSVR
ncbi:MAG: hypothetical protein HY397_02835 [Candidatus Doudnabacteria bacterium]|nr:hypothetical protein [Candidatus Doudnabacteria bacterium]